MEQLYKEAIMDHYKHPHNYGLTKEPDFSAKEDNIFCGDSIVITLKTKNNKIKEVGFQGEGCVISQATASMLTDHIKGKTLKSICLLTVKDATRLLGVSLSPSRMKCAELPLIAIKKALKLS